MHNLKNKIGYFFKRADILNIAIKELIQELHIHRLEAVIMHQAISSFSIKNLAAFDCLVGDCKCQAHTAMILDIVADNYFTNHKTSLILNQINNQIEKIDHLLNAINNLHQLEKQTLTQKLKKISLQKYLSDHDIGFSFSENTIFISLCFLTTPSNNTEQFINHNLISVNKIKALLIKAKVSLCNLTIQYEQRLAQKFGSEDEQKTLSQIESKGFCSMTALFPSFKHILNKTKALNQIILKKTIVFCACGGISNLNFNLLKGANKNFITITIDSLQQNDAAMINNEAAMIIEGYQFPGCFTELKNILGICPSNTLIPKQFYKNCICTNPSKINYIKNSEVAILASLAQHPQFTTDVNIDFERLELLNSNIYSEYKYLTSLDGYSRNNMSKYFVYHIYPSTIKDAFEEDKILMTDLIAQSQPNIINHQHINCPC